MKKKTTLKTNKQATTPTVRPLFWALFIVSVLVSICVIRVNTSTAQAIEAEINLRAL